MHLKNEFMKSGKWMFLLFVASAFWLACEDDDDIKVKELSASDKEFVQQVRLSNLTALRLGQLAVENTSDSLVKDYGQMVIAEHANSQNELQFILNDYDTVGWPTDLDAQHQMVWDQLDTLTGYSLDSLYLTTQLADFGSRETLFQTSVSNAALKSFASKYLANIADLVAQGDSVQTVVNANEAANPGDD
jgi:putative membrane protein